MKKSWIIILVIFIIALFLISSTLYLSVLDEDTGTDPNFQEGYQTFTVGRDLCLHFRESSAGHSSWADVYTPSGEKLSRRTWTSTGSGWHEISSCIGLDEVGMWKVDYSTSIVRTNGANFKVEALKPEITKSVIITPTSVTDGEEVTIEISLSNVGDLDGILTCSLYYLENGIVPGPNAFIFDDINVPFDSGENYQKTVKENIDGNFNSNSQIGIRFSYNIKAIQGGDPVDWYGRTTGDVDNTIYYEEPSTIICYRCQGEELETQEFQLDSCPEGWQANEPNCISNVVTCYRCNEGEVEEASYEESCPEDWSTVYPENCGEEPDINEENYINLYIAIGCISALLIALAIWRFVL